MLPLVARSCQEVLTLVPGSVKEAGLALGASRWRTTLSVIVPTALSGMITGALLAVARAAGRDGAAAVRDARSSRTIVQTDPSQALPNIPVDHLPGTRSLPTPAKHAQAWAAALVLIVFVLLISIVARVLSARMRRRLGAATLIVETANAMERPVMNYEPRDGLNVADPEETTMPRSPGQAESPTRPPSPHERRRGLAGRRGDARHPARAARGPARLLRVQPRRQGRRTSPSSPAR